LLGAYYTFLGLGDAHRFGPSHLKRILKRMAIEIKTEKSKGSTKVSIPIHSDFAKSLAAARDAAILGTGEVFTRKLIKGEVRPMARKAWAAKFKCSPCRDQRTQDGLPWRAQGALRTWLMLAQPSRT